MTPCPNAARAFAPGRVEIIGNHTDYNQGRVLSCALPHGVEVFAERIEGKRFLLRFKSDPDGGEIAIPANDEPQPLPGSWTNYPIGVIKCLTEAGVKVPPCRIELSSNLPSGAGLSSSAAIEVATATALLALAGAEMPPMDLARLCRRAENEFVGVNCGLLDQATSVCGRAGHVLHLDFRPETFTLEPFPPGHLFLIIPSGVKHALVGGEYNERRQQCFEAARLLGVPFLRDATSSQVNSTPMPDVVRRRALHVTGENERVELCLAALRSGDMAAFGQAMNASHQSSKVNFENSTPELDTLAEIAISEPGILGARLTGGGFGGAIVALTKASRASEAAKSVVGRYFKATGITTIATPYVPSDGARLLPVC